MEQELAKKWHAKTEILTEVVENTFTHIKEFFYGTGLCEKFDTQKGIL